jgi:hypothetical protein
MEAPGDYETLHPETSLVVLRRLAFHHVRCGQDCLLSNGPYAGLGYARNEAHDVPAMTIIGPITIPAECTDGADQVLGLVPNNTNEGSSNAVLRRGKAM